MLLVYKRIGSFYNLSNCIKNIMNMNLKLDGDNLKIEIKKEPEDPEENISIIDLHKFKFEKKASHVKIEYEKDSPKKDSEGLWQPANWNVFLENLRIMRSKNDAPVDSMGCHMGMDQNAPPKVIRYQSLISLMLSSQTKDQVTFAAMGRLRERGLTIENILKMSDDELGRLIYPVGFWKTKVKYIKKTTQTLKDQYDGDIPDSAEKLCKLTGVGPKMAHICMKVAWNKVTGIGVDTHVHRISNRIGWVRKPTATPEDTRKALETWLPFELWSEVNHLMVGFGQTICQPIGPLCSECLNKDICPSSGKGRKSPIKKSPKTSPVKQEVKNEPLDDDFEDFNTKVIPNEPKKIAKRKLKSMADNLEKNIDNLECTSKTINLRNKYHVKENNASQIVDRPETQKILKHSMKNEIPIKRSKKEKSVSPLKKENSDTNVTVVQTRKSSRKKDNK